MLAVGLRGEDVGPDPRHLRGPVPVILGAGRAAAGDACHLVARLDRQPANLPPDEAVTPGHQNVHTCCWAGRTKRFRYREAGRIGRFGGKDPPTAGKGQLVNRRYVSYRVAVRNCPPERRRRRTDRGRSVPARGPAGSEGRLLHGTDRDPFPLFAASTALALVILFVSSEE